MGGRLNDDAAVVVWIPNGDARLRMSGQQWFANMGADAVFTCTGDHTDLVGSFPRTLHEGSNRGSMTVVCIAILHAVGGIASRPTGDG